MNASNEPRTILDKIGIWLSSLCALHCLLLPVLVALMPIIGNTIFAEHWFERVILIASLAVGAVAMLLGLLRQHGSFQPLIFLVLGGVIYWFKDSLGHEAEPFVLTAGAILIVYGHTVNIKLGKQCRLGAESVQSNQA